VLRLTAVLSVPLLDEIVRPLREDSSRPDAVREVLRALLSLDDASRDALLDGVVTARRGLPSTRRLSQVDRWSLLWIDRLVRDHPGDVGALSPLLLNVLRLEPGEGLYIAPGVPHAYLMGAGVEVQATSDNVLRGGLTSKHVDVRAFLELVDPRSSDPFRVHPAPVAEGLDSYAVPTDEFQLWRAHPDRTTVRVPVDGPVIALGVRGEIQIGAATVRPGQAIYLRSSTTRDLPVGGRGEAFVACGMPRASLAHGGGVIAPG
jgi:mannose-6-phosphate isomerase